MQTVILDTNALLMPFEIRLNLDIAVRNLVGECRMIVPGPMIGELKHLNHKYARAALDLARRYDIVPTSATGDDAVAELALSTGGYVLTNDRELRTRLRKLKVPLIYLRSNNHLVTERY